MTDSLGTLAHIANELDGPLKASIDRLYKIIELYRKRDFEYISYKDFKAIFAALESIHRQLLRCSVTSSRLLANGKRRAKLHPVSSNINEVLDDILSVITKQVKSNITIKRVVPTKLPFVAIGHIECFQILNNLIMNAVQSMPAGGVITIKAKYDPRVKKLLIDIQDQGIGMSKEFLASIFEPSHTGLGLAVVHALVTVFGGSIDIKSSLRRGTRVLLHLPVAS